MVEGLSTPRYDARVLHDCRVPMQDGVSISADVYLPRAQGPFPTIIQWTPYESTRDRFIAWGVYFAQRGYAAIVVDVRGRYESGGEFVAYHQDGADAFDTLTWAAGEQWCNGRIGTWGRSYGAIVQWQLAPLGHPNLQCLSPAVIMDDYFDDCHYIGGAFQLALSLGATLIWSTAIGLVTLESSGALFLNERTLRHLPIVDLDVESIGRKVGFWREWFDHPTKDEFWNAVRHRPEAVTVPILQQAAWYDAYPAAQLRQFAAMSPAVPQKLIMGPWSHEEEVERTVGGHDFGPEATRVIRDYELRWYDHWLRDNDTGMMDEPPIDLFVMGDNRWRGEHQWPLPDTDYQQWFLHSNGRANTLSGDGRLSTDAPASEPEDRYEYDPEDPVHTLGGVNSVATMLRHSTLEARPGPLDQRPNEVRQDVLCYTSDPLERDTEVAGPIEMVLYAASSAPDTDWVVRLTDVYPDGRSLVVTEGIIRARYRHGLDRTELLEPGEPAEYRIRMYDTCNVFKKGHCLRLDVTSSSFPRFSRNLNTGEDVATGTRVEVAQQTVLHSSVYPSHIVLPIQPR